MAQQLWYSAKKSLLSSWLGEFTEDWTGLFHFGGSSHDLLYCSLPSSHSVSPWLRVSSVLKPLCLITLNLDHSSSSSSSGYIFLSSQSLGILYLLVSGNFQFCLWLKWERTFLFFFLFSCLPLLPSFLFSSLPSFLPFSFFLFYFKWCILGYKRTLCTSTQYTLNISPFYCSTLLLYIDLFLFPCHI